MTNVEVIERLKATKGQGRERIAEETGVPYGTLAKIACGLTKNPRTHHIDALRDYFQREATN